MPRHVVICGAGSAGCTLAARLTEDPDTTVTLLEAGPDYAQVENLPHEIRSAWVFGTNALRAPAVDFRRWQAMGADEWSWDAVLPYYRKLEDDLAPGSWHGQGGPVRIRRFLDEQQTALTKAYIEACQAAGHNYVRDLNGPNPLGVGPLPVNQVDGVRQSAALAYLTQEARARENLGIRAGVMIDRVEFDGDRARAVLLAAGEAIEADTIILSSGSYCSPPILLRSGIGPAGDLDALGIPIVYANNAVGKNMRDHPLSTVAFGAASGFPRARRYRRSCTTPRPADRASATSTCTWCCSRSTRRRSSSASRYCGRTRSGASSWRRAIPRRRRESSRTSMTTPRTSAVSSTASSASARCSSTPRLRSS